MKKAVIALACGQDRYQNVFKGLNLIKNDLFKKIKDKKRIFIKVNFVSPTVSLAATHVEAVKALLDFLKPIYKRKIKIVETGSKAQKGFVNFGYQDLPREYQVEFDDLSQSSFETINLFDVNLKKRIRGRLYREAPGSDFLVSLTPAKTHDYSIVTLGLKNVAVGFLKNASLVHQGYQGFNKNLYLLIKKIRPHLSIIDATIGMDGNGPIFGQPKPAGWVIASLDPVQADIVAAKLMGFDPQKIGYLYYCLKDRLATDNLEKITILGEKFKKPQVEFAPPDNLEKQLRWKQTPTRQEKIKAILAERTYTPFVQSRLGQGINIEPLKKLVNQFFGFQ